MTQERLVAERDATTMRERILVATLEVLSRDGPRKLSLTEVALTAGVSRPTIYRLFGTKERLLEQFGLHEQARYDSGLKAATAGLDGPAKLEAVLEFIVEFQHSYSLRRLVDIEPEHVLFQMARVLPINRDRLRPYFPGREGAVQAAVVTRVALSHYLLPDDDPMQFLRELRQAASLPPGRSRPAKRRSAERP